MQVCEVIYGCKRGAEIIEFLEGAMGHPCPCKQDLPCPLMPKAAGVEPAPRTGPPDVELAV